MTNKELVKKLAKELHLTDLYAQNIIRTLTNIITKELINNQEVKVSKFGTFSIRKTSGVIDTFKYTTEVPNLKFSSVLKNRIKIKK